MSPRGGRRAGAAPEPEDREARPHLRRVFVAIPLPPPARDAVAAVVDRVKAARSDGDESRDVRWVRLDGLHVTLRFIGPVDEAMLVRLGDAVDAAATAVGPFEIALEGAGAFPSPARPRALWLGVRHGDRQLAAAADVVEGALESVGIARSPRPFRAHLTLARADGIRAGPAVARRLIEHASGRVTAFAATELVLFETVGGGGPARYIPVRIAPLGGSTGPT